MECSCGLSIEILLRQQDLQEYRCWFDWENPGIIKCRQCKTTVATGEGARVYQEEYRNLERQDLNREAERKARDLAQQEAANPPRCPYCRDDPKAMRRPDLKFTDFPSSGYSPEGDIQHCCYYCGLVVGTEGDEVVQTSWVRYFFTQ